MSAGSGGEPGRDQDPWARPADFGDPGSAPPPPTWPGQQDQPAAGGFAPPSAGAPDQAAGQPAGPNGFPPPPNGFSPGNADPWAAPAGQYQPPAGPYQPPAGPYQPPAGPYGYPPSAYYPTAAAPRNNPVAIAALVCGIGQFVLGLLLVGNILLAIPAVICGAIGLKQINQRGERGRGMAIAGLVLGILGVVYFLIIVLLIIIGLHVRSS
ncbi:MAG: DUF4190 domain-containing protein [Streptosporangiaceae bacterium]